MSVSNLIAPSQILTWKQVNAESINTNSANFNGGGITELASINGMPIPSFTFDFNSTNIIYRPGGPLVIDSNIVNTWAAVLVKANQINVNQILNIYFDDSVVSPCPITVSHDFQGRANFLSVQSNYNIYTQVQINDGILISNLLSIKGSIQLNCQSITGPNLAFNNDAIFSITGFAELVGTSDSIIAAIELNNSSVYIRLEEFASLFFNSGSTPVINVTNNGFLVLSLIISSFIGNNSVSGDVSSSILYLYDASSNETFTNTGFLGSASYEQLDVAEGIGYNDSVFPPFNSTNVQGALDSLKNTGLSTSGYINAVGNIYYGDGSAANPSLALGSDHTTGIFRAAAITLGVSSGGTQVATFGPSNVQFYEAVTTNSNNLGCGPLTCSTFTATNQARAQYTSNTFITYTAGMGNSAYTQWNVQTFSVGGITCDGTTFTVPNTGLYLIETQNDWDTALAADTTIRELGIGYVNNGLFYGVMTIVSSPTNRARMSASTILQLNAGDQLQQYIYSGSLNNINIGLIGFGLYPPVFTIYQIL